MISKASGHLDHRRDKTSPKQPSDEENRGRLPERFMTLQHDSGIRKNQAI
jgi:hypothetical protein